jgi:predicted lipoprotein with Yx(FWY)xxD motif
MSRLDAATKRRVTTAGLSGLTDMTSKSLAVTCLLPLAVTVAACGSTTSATTATSQTQATGTPSQTATGTASASASATTSKPADPPPKPPQRVREPAAVHLARTQYGSALVDRRGFVLYLFTRDTGKRSMCYDACATAWPPYLLRKPPAAGTDAVSRLVGSVRRSDGTLQATYAGHPVYFYVGDRAPGQVLCQAVPEYGGTWYVIAKNGNAIR